MQIFILISYFVLTVSGLIFMKLGAGSPANVSIKPDFNISIGYLSLIGYILYICSFVLWTRIITMFDLTSIVPIATGVVQLLTFVAALLVFKEKITIYNVLGLTAIVIGIFLLNIRK